MIVSSQTGEPIGLATVKILHVQTLELKLLLKRTVKSFIQVLD